jgi:hypothetical protein
MKTIFTLLNKAKSFAILSLILLVSTRSFSQSCSVSTSAASWTTDATVGLVTSFTWLNTSTAGQFQKNATTAATAPVMQYLDAPGHSTINFSYDLAATSSTSTISSFTVTLIWGAGGATQVSATNLSGFTVSSTATRYNFQITGVSLPGNGTHFQVKLAMVIANNQKDVNATNFKADAHLMPSNATLPVQMNAFTASRTNSTVNVTWETLTESMNKGFEVERRIGDAKDFQAVAFVNSKTIDGNSSSKLNYSFSDANNSTGVSYYRIKQVDLDGKMKYSEIRVVDGLKSKAQTLVYPSPSTNGIVNIIFSNNDSKNIILSDLTGKAIQKWSNYSSQELKLSQLKPGMYFVQIDNPANNSKETQRIVVTR